MAFYTSARFIKYFYPKIVVKIAMFIKKHRSPLYIPILCRQFHRRIYFCPCFVFTKVVEVKFAGNNIPCRNQDKYGNHYVFCSPSFYASCDKLR